MSDLPSPLQAAAPGVRDVFLPTPPVRLATEPAMTTATWVTMIAICGFVWGGFVVAVRTAFKAETDKAD